VWEKQGHVGVGPASKHRVALALLQKVCER
jgi:hypothetical protein